MKISKSILKSNQKLILEISFGLLFVFLGIYFLKHEQTELIQVKKIVFEASIFYVILGIVFVFLFVVIQGMMYKYSFKTLQKNIPLSTGVLLYLKRNFISVFIPAGFITNMFFFNAEIEKKQGIDKTYIYYASTIFTICSLVSSVLILIPAVILLFLKQGVNASIFLGIAAVSAVFLALFFAIRNILNKGNIYLFLKKKFPSFIVVLNDLQQYPIQKSQLLKVLLLSIVIEFIGIFHLYIAMIALRIEPSITIAIIGYALVLIILLTSPFLRGIGAIELALTYVLTLYGISTVNALSVAFLFRFFEFWSVLVLGIFAFVFKKDSFLLRILPSILLFVLGIVNILSAITPSLPERILILKEFVPMPIINTSVWFTLLSGIFMLAVSAYLVKGLRNAWLIGVSLSLFSLIFNITKGIDWEEATLSLIVFSGLLFTRKQYFIKNDLIYTKHRLFAAITVFSSVIIFGTIGFYFIANKHFNASFSFIDALRETFTVFFLQNVDLIPVTHFGRSYLLILHILGFLTMLFWIYLFLKPYIFKELDSTKENRNLAIQILSICGQSSLDYFKVYADKLFWFNQSKTGFISYKIASNYAMVLEIPVGKDDETIKEMIVAFEKYCNTIGLKVCYYRVSEKDCAFFKDFNKKIIPIGAEAILDLQTFTLEGADKKSLRNGINKIEKAGFVFKVYPAPQKDNVLQQLKAVSTEWLIDLGRKEMLFSQGIFSEEELKSQTICTIETGENKIVGFVNIIKNYKSKEANFDLMRKTADAPNGTMDFLFVNMFQYFKEQDFETCNLGLVPMSGIESPKNLEEQIIKSAYEKIKRFSSYRSLYDFKEKFAPQWNENYLIFNDYYDLLFIPSALNSVMKIKGKAQ